MDNKIKTYVLDTNVLLSDPNALLAFGDNTIILPAVVLEELDNKKKQMDELGRNARYISRQLDELRSEGVLHEGVRLSNGGLLKVVLHQNDSEVFDAFLDNKNDNAIISVAKEQRAILVSKDVLVRVKADILSVKAEDYQNDKISSVNNELYEGYSELYLDDLLIDKFYHYKELSIDEIGHSDLPENHMLIMRSALAERKTAIGRKMKDKIFPLWFYNGAECIFGLKHKNVQQLMALNLLLDDEIKVVTISGKAGTGKTLSALAAALHLTLDKQKYNKVIVARPIVPMGRDLGYLPGDKNEKLQPWMQPIYDNLEYLFDCKDKASLEKTLEGYEDIIQVEALTYIRGRSIPNQIIIIDEAQNLTQHEVKTIISRVGEGSKIILVGDPYQIDHPYLDTYSNGLSYVTERFKEFAIAGHITLTRGERSELAQLAADIL